MGAGGGGGLERGEGHTVSHPRYLRGPLQILILHKVLFVVYLKNYLTAGRSMTPGPTLCHAPDYSAIEVLCSQLWVIQDHGGK